VRFNLGGGVGLKQYFRERAQRADRAETLRILSRAGKGNPPMKGDELDPEPERKKGRIQTGRRKKRSTGR